MNSPRPRSFPVRSLVLLGAGAALLVAAFQWGPSIVGAEGAGPEGIGVAGTGGVPAGGAPALRLALAAPSTQTPLDGQIREAQNEVREAADLGNLEKLATLFISKARTTGDPGFYTQAEACADAIPAADGGEFAAALIRGHVRHALHDFAAAERIARELVAGRGMFLDHGLLGDVLLDLGRLDEARESYQEMLNQKPGLQSYVRAAQVRWLMGDSTGCRELLTSAAASGSQRDPASRSWVFARRSALELQCNDAEAALRFADEALALAPDYPAALVARGRAALALGRNEEAVVNLGRAAQQYPLPEHQWGQADALRALGRNAEAAAVEMAMLRTGEREDPRTLALWLATCNEHTDLAQRLADAEFAVRQDAYTLDVLALARLRSGNLDGAREAMQRALCVGVRDARLSLHAALIAEAGGDARDAAMHIALAQAGAAALWPSERRELESLSARL